MCRKHVWRSWNLGHALARLRVLMCICICGLPDSPIRKSSYASQLTTPPGNLLQHHFMMLHSVWLC